MQQKQKKDCCQDKTVELKGVIWLPNKKKVNHEPIRWSNAIVDSPEEGNGQPWKKGDEPLSPFEIYVEPQKHLTPYQRIRQSHWYKADMPSQEQVVEVLLRRYLHEDEVKYYLRQLSFMARKHADTYMQVIQVIGQGKTTKIQEWHSCL